MEFSRKDTMLRHKRNKHGTTHPYPPPPSSPPPRQTTWSNKPEIGLHKGEITQDKQLGENKPEIALHKGEITQDKCKTIEFE
jgi:hypothetical protein